MCFASNNSNKNAFINRMPTWGKCQTRYDSDNHLLFSCYYSTTPEALHSSERAKDRKLLFPAPENKSKMLSTCGCERWGIKMRGQWSVDFPELCYSSSSKSKSREWALWCHYWWMTRHIRLIHYGIIAPDALCRHPPFISPVFAGCLCRWRTLSRERCGVMTGHLISLGCLR